MKTFHAIHLLGLLLLFLVLSASPARAQESKLLLPSNVLLRVKVADQIWNEVPGNRFVADEIVQVEASLDSVEVLEALASYRYAEQVVQAGQEDGASVDQLAAAEKDMARASAALARAKRALIAAPLASIAEKLEVRVFARNASGALKEIPVTAQRIEEQIPGDTARRTEGARVVACWKLEGVTLPSNRLVLHCAPTGTGIRQRVEPHEFASVEFDLVTRSQASSSELARAGYVQAVAAYAAGQYADAGRLAGDAARLATPEEYTHIAASCLEGDAYSALEQPLLALVAYRRAVEASRKNFPKDDLPEVLEPTIRLLEARLGR